MYQRDLFSRVMQTAREKENVIITGMRRVGKTTLLKQVFEALANANKLFLDLENPLNRKYFEEEDYDQIANALSLLGIDPKKSADVFLDEVQYVKTLPSAVKYLSDHYPIKFFLTGSASFYLKNLFTESLAGRKRIFELYPLSFVEFLRFKEDLLSLPKESVSVEAIYQRVQRQYEEYVAFGGFPEVVLQSSENGKRTALQEIFASYFNKEVLELGDFRKNQIIRDLMLLLLERVGSKIEIQKLAAELGVSRPTIQSYLAFLEGTYFFSFVRPFSRNRDVEIRNAPKVYCVDSGLASQIGGAPKGLIFENAIFHQLRLGAKEVQYYQKKSGVEIDFIVDKENAYEVKMMADERDLNRLQRLQKELKLRGSRLISYQFVEKMEVNYGWQI